MHRRWSAQRSARGGRPRAYRSVAHVRRQRVRAGVVDSSLCERPTPSSEETVERQSSPSSADLATDDPRKEPLRKAAYGKTVRAVVRPGKADVFSRRQTCQGKSQRPCSLDGREEGNQ